MNINEMTRDELAVALYENTAPLDLERKVQTPAESIGMTEEHIAIDEEGKFTDSCTMQRENILGVFAATIAIQIDIYNDRKLSLCPVIRKT